MSVYTIVWSNAGGTLETRVVTVNDDSEGGAALAAATAEMILQTGLVYVGDTITIVEGEAPCA